MNRRKKHRRRRHPDEGAYTCPTCGEPIVIPLDPSQGADQQYVEDCPVCCRPWKVRVRYRRDGSADVTVGAEGE